MLAIALIPSIVLMGAGLGVNSYLVTRAWAQRDTAELLATGYSMAVPFMPAMSEERRASIAFAAAPTARTERDLQRARGGMDALMAQFASISSQVAQAMPAGAKAAIERFVSAMPRLAQMRALVDRRQVTRLQVYQAYNQVADAMIVAADAIGRDSTDKDTALLRSLASDLMRLGDWLDRSNALAAAAVLAGGLDAAELADYTALTRSYRTGLAALAPRLSARDRAALDELSGSADWRRLGEVEDSLIAAGYDGRSTGVSSVPVPVREWQDAARTAATALSGMGLGSLGTRAAATAKQNADDAIRRSLLIAAASTLLALVVLIVAVRMSAELIRRLRRLRTETLAADARLPMVMERIRDGEQVDVDAAVPALDHGGDEIGEVASAFSKAQRTAVAAAVQEAQLREGANTVFLNIARRSQAVVQRQLEVLDRAERSVEDPDQVELLFQLDHLSTRERRNAENLIILGGGQLARQWRTAVPLVDVVRSGLSETEQYHRVQLGQVPEISVAGGAVADVIHLLAELVDNAVEFSPPDSRIEITSNVVGRGVVVEIEDQGIGIPAEQRERYNAMFRDPADFGVMALTERTQIGFFVVARLAQQHGIRVVLRESAYGGIRAVVLIPNEVIVEQRGRSQEQFTVAAEPARRARVDAVPGRGSEQRASVSPPTGSVLAQADSPEVPLQVEVVTASPYSDLHHWPAYEPPLEFASPESAGPEPSATTGRQPLPKRRRQTHLAPQLESEPAPEVAEPRERRDSERDPERGARHAQGLLSAFQQGSQRARAGHERWDD